MPLKLPRHVEIRFNNMQMILKIKGVEVKQNEIAQNRPWSGTNVKTTNFVPPRY